MLHATGLVRTFTGAGAPVHALRGVDLTVDRGRLVVVRGRSGSGKTTLLNLLGGLDTPDGGSVRFDGQDLTALGEDGLVALRRTRIGYVFQSFGLLPVLTAAENVGVPLRLRRTDPAARERRVAELLDLVGLGGHGRHRPYELSGGQQQRVAVARALAGEPDLLVADEPTGQLDSATGRAVMELVRSLVDERGVTAVVATHDPALVDLADAVVELVDGRVVPHQVDGPHGSQDDNHPATSVSGSGGEMR
ncbi:ABC transporter ATP-binding protein [Thalassiella azotivora]